MQKISLYHNGLCYQKTQGQTKVLKTLFFDNSFIFLKKYLKLKNNEAIIVLYSGYCDYENVQSLVKIIKKKNIKKIYFFIEDVFRIRSLETDCMQTHPIENDPENYEIPELVVIQEILKKINCEYEIYHCEYNVSLIEKKYNLKLKFFDYFLYEWTFASKQGRFNLNLDFNVKLSCLNHRQDFHRFFITTLLYEEKDVFFTLNNYYSQDEIQKNKALPLEKFSENIKSSIIKKSKKLNFGKLLWDTKKEFKSKTYVDPSKQHCKEVSGIIQNSFVNLVTETRFSTPTIYISEKTMKPIEVYRPFIILSSPYTLKFLKKLGFKTFDKWWDESYDEITDHNQRFEAVHELAKTILEKDYITLKNMLKEMVPILIFNQNLLYHKNFGEKLFLVNN